MGQVLLVDGRHHRRVVKQLEMQCDEKEIPDPLTRQNIDYFIATTGSFAGMAPMLKADGTTTEPSMQQYTGPVAIAVTEAAFLAILGPENPTDPAVWVSLPRQGIELETEGAKGLFSKRPAQLTFGDVDWALGIREVNQLFRKSGRYQAGQENALVKAIRGT